MKRLLLAGMALLSVLGAKAQTSEVSAANNLTANSPVLENVSLGAQKGAGTSDTGFYTYNFFLPKGYTNSYYRRVHDSAIAPYIDQVTPVDSGYYFGTNVFNNRGYAEKFYFNYKSDTTLRILGFLSAFTGTIKSTSTKTLTFSVYRSGAQIAYPGKVKTYHTGLPTTSLVSLNVPATKLGVGGSVLSPVDSFKAFWFASNYNLARADSVFFLGYTMPSYTYSSLGTDTFSIRSSIGGTGIGVGYYNNTALDTLLTDQNVFMDNSGNWGDLYTVYGRNRNLSILPIVKLVSSKLNVGVGITHNDLTFMGAFPNPASNQFMLHFALKSAADVTVTLRDMSGRTIKSETRHGLAIGEQQVPVQASELPSGEYLIMIQTSKGDGLATTVTIVK